MKTHIKLLFLGVISAITLNAQNTIKPETAVEMDAMRILYAGLENPVQIIYSGAKTDQLEAESDIGMLVKVSPGNYNISIPYDNIEDTANISVYITKENEPKKLVGTKQFRVIPVPNPTAYFGSKDGGEISVGEIQLVNFVFVHLQDFVFEGIRFTVHKFTFTYIPKSGTTSRIITNGAVLTPEIKGLLTDLKEGDQIIISDIWTSFTEGDIIKLQKSIVLTVK